MLGSAHYVPNLLTAEQGEALRGLVKSLKDYPTNVADVSFYRTLREDVGEAKPIDLKTGACDHPFLVPNSDRTSCVLPGRIDVGRHFILSGGPTEGLREPYEAMVSRVLSFGRYVFKLDDYPDVRQLFTEPRFLALARRVCPPSKQHLDPFQFNLILQLPGQTVAAHIDGAYFWGATRFQFPQWLLAAMVFSGRFADRFVDQVQVVAYLHGWDPASRVRAGEFIHWATPAAGAGEAAEPDQHRHTGGGDVPVAPKAYAPMPLAGSAIDGSKFVHAAEIYRGSSASPPLPRLDKNAPNVLSFDGTGDRDGWRLHDGNRTLQRYSTDDLRTSIVYRARCFADGAEAARFNGSGGPEAELLSLERVLTTLADEMVRRGMVASVEAALAMDRQALAVLIMDTFIKYPLPDRSARLVPYNYCALPRLFRARWLAHAAALMLSPLCAPAT